MASANDLDTALDGYVPEDTYFNAQRNNRQTRRIAKPESDDDAFRSFRGQSATRNAAPNTNSKSQNTKIDTAKDKIEDDIQDKSSSSSIVSFFTDKRLRVFLGFMLMLFCVFMLYALVSHFKYGEYDQSVISNSSLKEIAQTPGSIRNGAGGFGAWLSKTLFCDALGLGSIAFIVYAWLLGLALIGRRKLSFWSLTFKTLLVALTISMVLGLLTYKSATVMRWGGTHGHYANEFLMSYANWIGAAGVSVALLIAVTCVYFNDLYDIYRKWRIASYRRRMQEELRRQRAEKLAEMQARANEQVTEAPAGQPENKPESSTINIDVADTENKPALPAETITTNTPVQSVAQQLDQLLEIDDSEVEIDLSPRRIEEAVSAQNNAQDTQQPIIETTEADVSPNTPIETEKQNTDTQSVENTNTNSEVIDNTVAEKVSEGNEETASNESAVESADFSIKTTEIEKADIFIDLDGTSKVATPSAPVEPYDHRAELSKFRFPDIELLTERKSGPVIDMEEQQANKERIVKTLADYNIPISKIEATVGPTVTLYEIVPAEGVRISQIKRLEDDIALSLSALGIRIIAPIPGKGTVGIEVPNRDPQTVSMRTVITSKKYQDCKMALPMAIGATISNDIFIADLAKMPHMLVAGATGMGKSVGLNAIIASLLYKKHPSELKFVLVDPKMVEFSLYSKLERHYLAMLPGEDDAIITDPSKVIQTLNSLCVEMDDRYALLRKANVRSLEEYNKKFTDRKLMPKDGHKYLPYIVVIVDEFADLIMTAGKEVETPIARIAQKARAVGMHMIIATQRPSTNVITGMIKANFPGRIAFRVIQMVDSRTILDTTGANQLIGRGDMLFSHNGSMDRVQCAFISTEEVEGITEWIGNQVGYEHPYYLPEYQPEGAADSAGANLGDRDALFDEAARFVVQRQIGSTSSLQRQFNIGYNRAGRLMDQMEAAGIIGPVNGAKPRNILMDSMTLEQILNQK